MKGMRHSWKWAVALLLALGLAGTAAAERLILPKNTKTVDNEAFLGAQYIDEVVLPDSIRFINSKAFAGTSIVEVALPNHVVYIADDAFEDTGLRTVIAKEGTLGYLWAQSRGLAIVTPLSEFDYTISDGKCIINRYRGSAATVIIPATIEGCPVTEIGKSAFSGLSNLTGVGLPASLLRIGDHAFDQCKKLAEIALPEGLTEIGDCAFNNCSALKSIDIPAGVASVGEEAFLGCYNLARAGMSEGLTSIGPHAFVFCRALESVTLPDSLQSLGSGAFAGCSKISEVRLPKDMTVIPDLAFEGCYALKRIELPAGLTEIGYEAFRGTGLEEIELGEYVTKIGIGAFNCSSLKSVVLSSSLTTLYDVFGSGLERIVIPRSVTFISDQAFPGMCVIYGFSGSYAQKYASRANHRFVPISLSEFKANDDIFAAGEPNDVVFTVKGTDYLPIRVVCAEDGESLGQMRDDGLGGDAAAGDGVYTLELDLTYDTARIGHYRAEFAGDQTADIALTFYEVPRNDPERAERMLGHVQQSLLDVEHAYADGSGYIPSNRVEAALAAAEDCAEAMVADGYAMEWYRSEDQVSIRTIYGITYDFIPPIKDTLFGGSAKGASASSPSHGVQKWQTPFDGTRDVILVNALTTEDTPTYGENPLDSYVETCFGDSSIARIACIYRDEGVDRSVVSAFRDNSIILWGGHGTYDQLFGSGLSTKEVCDNGYLDAIMMDDFWERRIDLNQHKCYVLLSGYIDKYCPSIKNSFVYLNCCSSCQNKGLAESFRRKGAAVVVGNIGKMDKHYGYSLIGIVLGALCSQDNQGNYYTVAEALNIAKNEYGRTESEFCTQQGISPEFKVPDPYVTYIGDGDFRLVQSAHLSGRVTEGTAQGTPLTGVSVKCYRNGVLLHEATTDASGRYEMYVTDGEVEVAFEKKYYRTETAKLTVRHEQATTLDKPLSPTHGLLTLRIVRGGTEVDVPDAKLTLTGSDGKPASYEIVSPYLTGKGLMLAVAPGRYTVSASKQGYGEDQLQLTVPAGRMNMKLTLWNPAVVHGKVCKASDRTSPLSGVTVSFYRGGGLSATATSDSDGAFTMSLNPGDYKYVARASGYRSFTGWMTVMPGEENYFETCLMIVDATGNGVASGSIINAYTGENVAGVSLTVRGGWNSPESEAVVLSGVSDESGKYALTLPIGNYTVAMSKEGFIASAFNIIVNPGETDRQNGSIEPNSIIGNNAVIRLEWGASPSDLDAHIRGTLPSGEGFEVCYTNKSASYEGTLVCRLDVDRTNGYGPEHITLNMNHTQPYYYYVYKYSGEGSLASSGARVSLYLNGRLSRVFYVPTNLGNGRYWNVFAIQNGRVVVRNTVTGAAETSYCPAQ